MGLAAEELPLIRRATQLAANDGQRVRVQGIYEVYTVATSLPGARVDDSVLTSNRAARLRLEGGMVLQLGIRPRQERDLFNGREVRAVGKLVMRPETPPLDPTAAAGPQPTLQEVGEVVGYP